MYILSKGLNFAITPKNSNCADTLWSFKLLYRNIGILDVTGNDENFTQCRLRYCGLTSYRDTDKISERNLSKGEHWMI